jgi:hypothetical protein
MSGFDTSGIDSQIRALHARALEARTSGDRATALDLLNQVKELTSKKERIASGELTAEDVADIEAASATKKALGDATSGAGGERNGVAASGSIGDAADKSEDPEEWLQYETDDGVSYFYNRRSQRSIWTEPEGGIILNGDDFDYEEDGGGEEAEGAEAGAAGESAVGGEATPTAAVDTAVDKQAETPSASAKPQRKSITLQDTTRRASLSPESILDGMRRRSSGKIPAFSLQGVPATEVSKSESVPEDDDEGRLTETDGVWESCAAATFGDGTGDDNDQQVYFRNSVTGETRWEAPEDFGVEKPRSDLEGTWEKDDDFKVEVKNMHSCLTSENPLPALHHLCELSQSVGTEEEWIDIISGDDTFAIPKVLFDIVIKGHDPGGLDYDGLSGSINYSETFGYALRNLVLFSKLHSGIWCVVPDLRDIISALYLALPAILELDDNEEESLVCLMLMQEVFANCLEPLDVVGELLSAGLVVIQSLTDVKESAYVQSGRVLLTLNSRSDIREAMDGPPVINMCRTEASSASSFVEVTMNILNDNGFPDGNSDDVIKCLGVFVDIFRDPDTANMMYTNDTNLLIEMLIRELENLPEMSALRAKYVEVLHLLILNSSWGEERYKRAEIAKTVETLTRMGVELAGVECQEAVEDLLADCVFLLEE